MSAPFALQPINALESAKTLGSFERFHCYEMEMFERFQDYWPINTEYKALSKEIPALQIRNAVLQKLERITQTFDRVLIDHSLVYERRKQTLHAPNEFTKKLNDRAMDNMRAAYCSSMLPALLEEVEKIKHRLSAASGHFQRFQQFLNNPNQTKEAALEQIKKMHAFRRELNKDLFDTATKAQACLNEVAMLNKEAKEFGPIFNIHPSVLASGMPVVVKKSTGMVGKPIEELIDKIEEIKQRRAVRAGVEPFYMLFLCAMQSMRKNEKGMIKCLANAYGFPSGFEFDKEAPEASLESRRQPSFQEYQRGGGSPQRKFSLSSQALAPPPRSVSAAVLPREGEVQQPESVAAAAPRRKSQILEARFVAQQSELQREIDHLSKQIENLSAVKQENRILQSALDDLAGAKQCNNQELEVLKRTLMEKQVHIERFKVDAQEVISQFKSLEEELLCPITQELMRDPVVSTVSGMTFEREAIIEALKRNPACPLTRRPMTERDLIPNHMLKGLIGRLQEKIKRVEQMFILAPPGP